MAVELRRHLITQISGLNPEDKDLPFLRAELNRTETYLEDPERVPLPKPISPRELEVLYLISRGYGYKEAAYSLGISPQTLKNYSTSIHRKLDAATTLEALLKAESLGIIDLEKAIEGLDPSKARFLSQRELEIMKELTDGGPTNKEIAARLGVTEHTVKNNMTSIYKKLGVGGSRIRAAMLYVAADRQGLVPFSP